MNKAQKDLKIILAVYRHKALYGKKSKPTETKIRKLFLACHNFNVKTPPWLTEKILEILNKQADLYKRQYPLKVKYSKKTQLIELLEHTSKKPERLSDVDARIFFLSCHQHDVRIPDWLSNHIKKLLDKQVKSEMKKGEYRPYEQDEYSAMVKEKKNIEFMWAVDEYIKMGMTQDDAVVAIDPDCFWESDARQYRRLKDYYGDAPSDVIIHFIEE